MENNLILILDDILTGQEPERVEPWKINAENLEIDIILPPSIYNDYPIQNGLCGCNRQSYYIAKFGKVPYISINNFVITKAVEKIKQEFLKLFSGGGLVDVNEKKEIETEYFDIQNINKEIKLELSVPLVFKDDYFYIHPLFSYSSVEKHITGGRSLTPYPKIKDIISPYLYLYNKYMTTGKTDEVKLIYYSTKDGANNEFTISFVPGDKYRLYVNGVPNEHATAHTLLTSANDLFSKIKTGQLPEPAHFLRYPVKYADAFLYYGIIGKNQYKDLVRGEILGDNRCTYCPFISLCEEDAN